MIQTFGTHKEEFEMSKDVCGAYQKEGNWREIERNEESNEEQTQTHKIK